MGLYQASAELDDELIIRVRCVGAGEHVKHVKRGSLRTSMKEHWSSVSTANSSNMQLVRIMEYQHKNRMTMGNEVFTIEVLRYIRLMCSFVCGVSVILWLFCLPGTMYQHKILPFLLRFTITNLNKTLFFNSIFSQVEVKYLRLGFPKPWAKSLKIHARELFCKMPW